MNFQVADWYVDVDANRIQRLDEPEHEHRNDTDSQDIKLEGKVMSLLVYLARNQGNVISREQLEAEVWSDRVISYDALTSCITRLRKVLGDDSRNPVYIETVPKKGYRLIATVTWDDLMVEDEQAAASVSGPAPEVVTTTDDSKTIRYFISLALLLLAIVIAANWINDHPANDSTTLEELTDGSARLPDAPTIMVLPFDNLSNDSAQNYFSDGITADISIALSKLSGLQVIATPSMMRGEGQGNNMRRTEAQRLARYIVTGSVQRAVNKLRVNVVLVDSSSQRQLWAESYDREITEVFEVQDEITVSIVSSLSIKLTEEEKSRVAHRYTNSIEAYDHFLRGQALYTQHNSNENLLARDHLNRAIQIDPNFARAYSTLALTYIDEYRYRWYESTDSSLFKTLELAETAITIDESLPQAYWSLAYAQLHLRRYDQASSTINHILAKRPNYADGYALLAIAYIYQGDPENGIKMIRKAMRLNPSYPAQYTSVLGQAYYYLQDYENALNLFRKAIDKNFSIMTAHIMQTVTLSKAGMMDDASWSAEQLRTIKPTFKAKDITRVFPIKAGEQRQDIIDQLRKAGIK
jgi:TolB-like protein/DNA-binding winged helix-turn-helix (wHTH) protein